MTHPDLLPRLAGYRAVTCDVFDTALLRRLARPEDLHLATGVRLGLEPARFRALRLAAEQAVRRAAEEAGRDEPTLAGIYAYLAACGVEADPVAELAAERAVCFANPPVLAALNGRAPGQRLVFVSDTVLPGAALAGILQDAGYGPCEVVTSADTGLSKHSGRLYTHVLERLGCAPGDVVHLGDNPHSDGRMARAAGLATVALPPPGRVPERADVAAQAPALRLLHSMRRAAPAPRGRFALLHRRVALLAIGFTLFVLAEARRRGVGRIHFLARDGWLPLAIARRLVARTGEAFDLRYLEVSRRSALGGPETELRAYLAQEGFLDPGERLVVDVGWRGTIQAALAEIAGVPVAGCYLGLLPAALRPGITPGSAACYLFGFGHPAPRMDMVMDGYALLEMFFSAPTGSVLGYARDGATIAPVHAEEAEPGATTRRAAFAAIEAGVLAEFDALDAVLGGRWPEAIDPDSALFDLAPLLTMPGAADVAEINTIPFIHGPDGGSNVVAVNRMPWRTFVLDPEAALRRAANCPWRAGWVRANLPWPFPPMTYATFRDRAERYLKRR